MKWAGRPFRDEAFSREDWDRHVTWRRYLFDGLSLPIVVLSLSPLLLWPVLVSTCVGLYARYAEPRGWPQVSDHPDLIVPFSLTSFALSLLMLFKTNSAYARWWEARTQLGQLYINVRSVMRMVVAWVGPGEPHVARGVYQWTTAVMPALCAYLRENAHYYRHLDGVLPGEEVAWLAERGIPPVAALQVVSCLLAAASLSDIQRSSLETVLNSCDTVVGACERIQRQPMPLAYNRHTHRFLIVYLTFLPLALWPLYEWFTLPVMAVLALLLLGVENIGIQIEEPFRVLPLDQMCAASRRATTYMLDDRASVHSMAAATREACAQQEAQAAAASKQRVAAAAAPAGPGCDGGVGGVGRGGGGWEEEVIGRCGAPGCDPLHQFSRMSELPAGLGESRSGMLGLPQLLGMASTRPEGRNSWDGGSSGGDGQLSGAGGGQTGAGGGAAGQGPARQRRLRSWEATMPRLVPGEDGVQGGLAFVREEGGGLPRGTPDVEQAGGRREEQGGRSATAIGVSPGQGRPALVDTAGWEPSAYPVAR